MGLANSTDNSTAYVTMSVLRAVLGFDMPINTPSRHFEVPPLKSRSLNDANLAEGRRQNDCEMQYNWLLELANAQGPRPLNGKESESSPAEIIQQIVMEQTRRRSKKVETDVQQKVEKETATSDGDFRGGKVDQWFVSQWYQSVDGMRYGITIDTNNSEVMEFLESYSIQSSCGIDEDNESVAELSFNMKSGEELVLRFDRRDPTTLEVLTEAMIESVGNPPVPGNKIDAKQIYSFVFVDRHGHRVCCSLDMNNPRVLRKLKVMEGWALELADPCDLFDIKMDISEGSTTTIQLDLKNMTTIRNLRALKEESLTGKSAMLVNPIRKKEKVQELLISDLVSQNAHETSSASVELFSPYTGHFTAVFDMSDSVFVEKLHRFNDEFKGSFYQYLLTIEVTSEETYEVKLDMANPRVVYELIMMSRKHKINVVTFEPEIILNNLITVLVPEDETFLTLDISRSVVYGALFEVSNRERKGVKLTVPCKGDLVHLYLDVTNPKVVNKIRSFSLATIVSNVVRKLTLITLVFINTPVGVKPVSLDLADKKNVMEVCKVIRSNPAGENPSFVEVLDDTGQFITVSLDLNNPHVVECLMKISKAAWFVSINAIQCPYLAVCLPCDKKHKTIRVRLKPVIIDEMAKVLDKYCPDYTLLEIFDSRRKCSIIYIDPTMPNLFQKIMTITNAVQILPPANDNAVTIYNSRLNNFVDIDLSLSESRGLLLKFEEEYRSDKPLAIIKYHSLNKEMFAFVNVDDQFLREIQKVRADLGQHVRLKPEVQEEYMLKITDASGTSLSLPMNLADANILRELDKLTNSDECNISTTDAFGYPIKIKIDASSNTVIKKLIALNDEISKTY